MILKMNASILTIAVLIFGALEAQCRAIDDMDNAIEPERRQSPFELRDWIKITKAPPAKIIQSLGSTTEIVCEAMGSPAPTIKWVSGKINVNELRNLDGVDNYESNVLSETNPNAIVRVRSVFVIDHLIASESSYSCVAQSAEKIAIASTTVYASPDEKNENLSELLTTEKVMVGPRKPRITYSHTLHIDIVGSNIILPCKVDGRPKAEIFWMNSDGFINDQNPRFKILNDGSMLITDLKWEDMGAYKCLARNSLGKDSADTFVYPALKE